MTNEELDRLEHYASQASAGGWQWTCTPTQSRLAAIWWMARVIWKGRGPLWGITQGGGDAPPWIAVTGNGPDSEANSEYLHAAQPTNIMLLIDALREARRNHP